MSDNAWLTLLFIVIAAGIYAPGVIRAWRGK